MNVRGGSVLGGLLIVATLAAGCGRKGVAPDPLPTPSSPAVAEVFPAARSRGVFYGTEIWARFAEPLDPATIDERTVFLKIDALRIPSDVRWDAATQRIVIVPRQPLSLNRTHTVWLSTAVRTASGVALAEEFWWQFRTMSVRIPAPRSPVPGVANKGPWTNLSWDPTESSVGLIAYEVYAGGDSAAVAGRAAPPLLLTSRAWYRPRPAWPLSATLYWSVRVTNTTTGESCEGPVQRFETLPQGLPIDSLQIVPSQWGWFNVRTPANHPCFGEVVTGDGYNDALRYDLSVLPAGLELASVRIDAWMATSSWSQLPGGSELWAAIGDWLPCLIGSPGPPDKDVESGLLAEGGVVGTGRLRFADAALNGYFQDALERGGHADFTLRSSRTLVYTPVVGSNRDIALRISYYRLPPTPRP